MNYIGAKTKLLDFIFETITDTVGDLKNTTFCDMFSGTGIVGRGFKGKVKKIISNDMEYYSKVINMNYIGNTSEILNKEKLIFKLNNINPICGFIYKNYCPVDNCERMYFTPNNGAKIDAIRIQIEKWRIQKEINSHLYFFLLTSLLESADKIANTASVYGAYLKNFKKTAQKDLVMKAANYELTNTVNDVYNEDANSLIKKISGDILYLDPPYNTRQYGANYHLLNTIAKYDSFSPKGKTGLREYDRSLYCSKRTVMEVFENLIKDADFKYIFLSYNNEGLIPAIRIKEIMSKYGLYSVVEKEYKRFKADSNRSYVADKTIEYIHILEKK